MNYAKLGLRQNTRIYFRETIEPRVYLRTGSCPEGKLISKGRKVHYRLNVQFGQLRALSRFFGYPDAVKRCLSEARLRAQEKAKRKHHSA